MTEEHAKSTTATVIPCLRYRDAPAAIEWLERVFGFRPGLVVPGDGDEIEHAQLHFGTGMIMIGSHRRGQSNFDQLVAHPDEVGGVETQSAYLVVEDADAVYASAKAAGARIAIEIKDEDYGGRGFSCFDLEGRLWSIGTYDPWQTKQEEGAP